MTDRQTIRIGSDRDGNDVTLPVVNVLTGRGFVTGKSGSGKSNTASVIAEELLEAGYPLLVVDTDGEYYGLKEEYEMLHAGADEECDVRIGPEHAEQMASLALEENVPVILDVSGYLDEDEADELLRETARHLFVKEKKLKKPFLLVVEEVHEYIPEGGGVGETGRLLIKIGKRGRKHGLGIVGISQRPADVKKDFITQANWLVWHRLTWDNDTNVVGRIIDTEYADRVSRLDDGQAFLQTDWTDGGVNRIQFRRKRTFDAGATPGLDDFERPELKSVSDALVGNLEAISDQQRREEDRIERLERQLDHREQHIAELEDELAAARNVSAAARRMAEAISRGTAGAFGSTDAGTAGDGRDHEAMEKRRELAAAVADREERIDELLTEVDELTAKLEARDRRIDVLETALAVRTASANGAVLQSKVQTEIEPTSANGDDLQSERQTEIATASATCAPPSRLHVAQPTASGSTQSPIALGDVATDVRIERACGASRCSVPTARRILAELDRNGPLRMETIAERIGRSTVAVQSLLSELRTRGILDRTENGGYELATAAAPVVSRAPESE